MNIFEKIINRQLPASIVYEDENFLAFLDIHPVSKGHTLLIPKQQFEWIHEMPDDVLSQSFIEANRLIKKMRKGLPCDYVQLAVVGKDVPHFHIHLIPRYFDDGLPQFPTLSYGSDEEKEEYRVKIQNA